MAEITVSIPFRYRANVVLHRARKPTVMSFRGAAPIRLERVAADEAEVALRIRDWFAGKPYEYVVYRCGGRLWWPFGNAYGDFPARRSFERLESGQLCLNDGNLEPVFPPRAEDVAVAEIIPKDHDEMLADIQRTAGECLVIGDELRSAGGVPMLAVTGIEASPLLLFNPGSGRCGDRTIRGLAVHPGSSLASDVDQLWVRGCCHRYDSPAVKATETEMTRLGYMKLPQVVGAARDGEMPDCFDLRADAAFRIVRHARLHADFSAQGPETDALQQLSKLFADATPHEGRGDPTPRRLHAIHRFLMATSDLPIVGLPRQQIAEIVERGISDGRVSGEQLDQPEWGLRPVEDEALSEIATG